MDENAKDLFDRMLTLADVVSEASITGQAWGSEIVSSLAAMLQNGQKYGFTFRFWRIDEIPALRKGCDECQHQPS